MYLIFMNYIKKILIWLLTILQFSFLFIWVSIAWLVLFGGILFFMQENIILNILLFIITGIFYISGLMTGKFVAENLIKYHRHIPINPDDYKKLKICVVIQICYYILLVYPFFQ